MKKSFIILFCILCVAAALRLYKLGEVPISPDWDEAALGYNAYSILKTGKDEYGMSLPLAIRSFDDYKPPLYVYLTVPSVWLFGLSVWSTRLPSVIMGILAVLGVFVLVRKLFEEEKSSNIALLSSFLLAISPWHIHFSRIAFEANTGITINIWAVAVFLIGLKKRLFLPVSAALFGLGFYAYHSERVFLPLLVILMAIIYRRQIFIRTNYKFLFVAVLVGFLVILPLIPVLFTPQALLRVRGTSSFTDQTNLLTRSIDKLELDQKNSDMIGALLDNRRIVWVKTILSGYLSHFSLRWLFMTGDNPRHHAPDMGLLYLWELPFLLYGIYYTVTRSKDNSRLLLIGWFLLSPVAASPTTGLPHAIRSLVFLPTFQIFTALGIYYLAKRIPVKNIGWQVFLCTYSLFIIFNFMYFLHMYFIHQNPEYSQYWQYGYKDAVALSEKLKHSYKKVVVSTNLEQSYMFYLFYTTHDPHQYLQAGGTKSGSFEEAENSFDKYEFRKIDWSKEVRDGSILYVGAPGDMPHGNIANITFLDGTPAIEMADQPNGAP